MCVLPTNRKGLRSRRFCWRTGEWQPYGSPLKSRTAFSYSCVCGAVDLCVCGDIKIIVITGLNTNVTYPFRRGRHVEAAVGGRVNADVVEASLW